VTLEAASNDRDETPKRRRRRRRRRGQGSRVRTFGSSVLPSLLTTGNLAAGFYAIVKSSTGEPLIASYAIFVAAIFDILDGRAARMTGSESRFGAEYDSIADTVSFGVAPAVIAFHAGDFGALRWSGWVLAFLFTACASLRLARFNVSSGRFRGRFDGLPSPAAAGVVVSAVWFGNYLVTEHGMQLEIPAMLLALGVAAVGLLMVTPIPYRNFKEVNVKGSYGAIVAMVVVSIALIEEPGRNFFLMGLAYTASGPIEWLWRRRTGVTLEEMIKPILPGEEPQADGASPSTDPSRSEVPGQGPSTEGST
jgi:CDP-diacylglycerol--serine O-phosphatidyltransferase